MTAVSARRSPTHAPGPSIEAFEQLNFDPSRFDHEAHVYVAWQYLGRFDLLQAIDRYRSTLRRLTDMLGVPQKYNETITWFYLIAVAETRVGQDDLDFESWKAANPALIRRSPGLLQDFYSEDRLNSPAARQTFLLPDRAG